MADFGFDEELVGSTELARAVAATLDRAATHPVTVHRDRAEDVTMIPRHTWLRLQRADHLQSLLLSLSAATAHRFSSRQPAYPSELYWLEWLDNDDYADFLDEFTHTIRELVSGHTSIESLRNMLYEWEQSALVLRDPHLLTRLTRAEGHEEAPAVRSASATTSHDSLERV